MEVGVGVRVHVSLMLIFQGPSSFDWASLHFL